MPKDEDHKKQKPRDLRNCTFSWVDNQVFDNYLEIIGKTTYLVYCVYTRHANNRTQKSWPSNIGIAKKLHISKATVIRCQKKLVKHELVEFKKRKGKTTIYTLLTPKKYQNGSGITGDTGHLCSITGDTGSGITGDTLTKTNKKRTKTKHCRNPRDCDKHIISSSFNGDIFDIKASEELYKIIKKHKNISNNTTKWPDVIRRLRKVNKVSKTRIKEAIKWYKEHVGEEFVPVIECAITFRKKFTRLEDAMKRQNRKDFPDSDDEDDADYIEPEFSEQEDQDFKNHDPDWFKNK